MTPGICDCTSCCGHCHDSLSSGLQAARKLTSWCVHRPRSCWRTKPAAAASTSGSTLPLRTPRIAATRRCTRTCGGKTSSSATATTTTSGAALTAPAGCLKSLTHTVACMRAEWQRRSSGEVSTRENDARAHMAWHPCRAKVLPCCQLLYLLCVHVCDWPWSCYRPSCEPHGHVEI